ncbi:MAG: hypothetical protein A2Y50_08205 [Pseudomonadales bacterium RIFCSPLOWO2_12_59_9]|nr:MAG: hypothetical protein A2Y50_08205 [Pseudomonadales bacterium RIFCSPLOWO2_12_59_9]
MSNILCKDSHKLNSFKPSHTFIALAIAAATAATPVLAAPAPDLNYNFSAGKLVSDSETFGNVTLGGSITATTAPQVHSSPVVNIRGAHVLGDLTNNATINAAGLEPVGISISASYANQQYIGTQIDGNFINAGSITATGDYADAIDFWGNSKVTAVSNSGTISASGLESAGLLIDKVNLLTINNSGTIQARGVDADAVYIEEGTFASYTPEQTFNVGIVNSGTISADGVGIFVYDFGPGSAPLQINQKGGLIEGGVAAIQGDGADLNWSGGKIKGDILDIGEVNIIGDATFDGANIQTRAGTGFVGIVSGKLSLVGPYTSIAGNLSMDSGSTLELFLGNNTSPTTALLSVSQTAYFDPNSKVQLQANANDFRTATGGTEYQLISAGAIVGGNNLNVASSSALLEVKSFSVAGNQVKALVASKSDAAIVDAVSNAGGSNAAAAAVVPLASAVLGDLSTGDPVFTAFANAGSDAELVTLAEQLTPEVNGGDSQAAKTDLSLVNAAIGSRASAARSGLSSGDLLSETGVWAQGLSSDATQDDRQGIAGYDADSNGIAIGADGKLNEATTLGLAYSYLSTDVSSGGGNQTDVTGNALTAYGNWAQDNWFVEGSSTYGWNDNESKRSIAGTQAKADYDSEFLGLNALAGYSYSIDKNLIVEPQIGARYTNISIDSYNEKGSSAALSVGAQRYEIGEMGAGVRLVGAFELAKGSLEPQAKVMAWHDFIGDEVSSTSTFVLGGTPFTTTGSGSVRDSYELGLGLDYKLDAWTVGGSYNYLSKTDFNADSFTAKVRYDF